MEGQALSSAIADFSMKFLNELEKNKSIISSPLSVEFVLALLALGTSEPAHSELLAALSTPDNDSIRSSFSTMSSKLKSLKGVTLNIANKVYIKDGDYDLKPKLKEDAIQVFDAEIEKVDFGKSAAAAAMINNWVENKTNNKIKDLLTSDSLSDDTRLVLINALYFKGTWDKKFSPQLTKEQPFYVDSTKTINVPMMNNKAKYQYGDSVKLNAQLLQMHYVGKEASMLIVLPKDIEGLDGVLSKLANGHDLIAEINNMRTREVNVTIPKFKIETTIDLKSLLPKLGVKAIFDQNDSGLTEILNKNERLFVSEALQKAYIEVNEEGAEAAAATGFGIMLCSIPPPPVRFLANRPFLYLLIGANSTALFVGVYHQTS